MASTLTAGDVFGAYQGYYPAFSAGSLSPDTFGGFTCTNLVTGATAGNITAGFTGDATSFLSGKAISVNGTAYSTITSGPTYDGGSNTTSIEWAYGPGNFTVGNSYTIDIGAGGPSTQTLTPSLFTNSQTFFAATVTQPFFGPSYVGVSTGAGNAAGTTISFSSSGRASGDLLFIAVMTANQAVTISGWTEVATYSPQSRGTAGAAGGVRLTLFSKTSDGTEGNVTTSDSGDIQYAAGLVVRGYSGASVAIDTGAGNNVAATTSGSFGGVTTTGSDRLIASFVATDRDAAAASWTPTGYGNLANGAERFDNGTSTNTGGGIAIYTGEKASAGATGNITATQAASAAYCWITLALANASAGTQTLTPSLFTNSQTFYGPTVTRGAVTLLPSLVTNSQTFYAPTVSATYALSPALFTNAQSFYSATVTQGAVTLSPPLVTNNQTFYSATVSASITLSPSLYTNTQTFFGPTVAGNYTLAPALVANSQTFYAATVAPGLVTLSPSLFTNTQTFYSATVSSGSATLLPSLLTNQQTFYVPTVTRGAITLTPALYTNSQSFFSPTVSQGGQNLFPTLVTNSQVFYAPLVQSYFTGSIVTTYSPAQLSITAGSVTIEPIRFSYDAAVISIAAADVTFGPNLSTGLTSGALQLNRIMRGFPIVQANGEATTEFQLKYQRNCEGTEQAINSLADQVTVLQAIVAGLQEAQLAAAQANQGVATLNAGVSLSSSRTNPVDGLLTATSDGVITVSAHQRIYTTGSTETSVTVNAGSVSGFAQGAFVRVYYNDAARAGGAVAYLGTTDEITQVGDTHVIGGIAIPTAGSPPATGTGTTPPGYVREQVVGTGGAQA